MGYISTEQRSGATGLKTDGFNVNGSVGIGVDWFPLSNISIGGYTGLGVVIGHRSDDDDFDRKSLQIATTTSGLVMHIYFGGADTQRTAGR